MCELFGYSGYQEQALASWLEPFRARGGRTADNPDGWGVASWQGENVDIVKSPEPGFSSERFVQLAQDLRGRLVIAHVRKARHPPVPGMLNTHPFAHDCCDRQWVFAHNGMVPDIVGQPCPFDTCRPTGETDSEFAFCHLLAGIVHAYDPANIDHWLALLARHTNAIAMQGKFNFLLSDGTVLIAHGHDRLHHSERAGGVVLVATEPLDAGAWRAFVPGELRVYRDGALLAAQVSAQSDDACRL